MIDMNKKYTFKGYSGRVLAVDVNNDDYPVIWVKDVTGGIYIFTADGRQHTYGQICLLEAKPTRWINIYEERASPPMSSKKEADYLASEDRIACIEFKEGDGI